MHNAVTYDELYAELLSVRSKLLETTTQLEEAKETISAIQAGEVDALIIQGTDGHQLYTLKTADQTYRIFIEQMIEGAVTLDEHARIMYSNSRFAELVNIPLEKIIGQSFYNFLSAKQRPVCEQILVNAWHNDLKTECELQSQPGETLPVLLSLKVLYLDEGPALSIIVTDLTLQKKTQAALEQKNQELEQAKNAVQQLNQNLEATVRERTEDLETTIRDKEKIEINLRQNQQRLSRILETMAEGVCIVDTAGNLEYANAMAHKLFLIKGDRQPLNLYDNDLWESTTIDGVPITKEVHPLYISMITGKTVYDHEIGVRLAGKELMYISINATPIYDDRGELSGSIGTFTNVTNRRIAIQQKDDFINVASHELKTPITTLNGYLQLLEAAKSGIPEGIQHLIGKAGQSMARVIKLIHELLDNSKITGGQWSIRRTEFVLADVVADCIQYISAMGVNKVVVTGDITTKIYADPDRIGQVVTNFLSNAVKYAQGSREIFVMIEKQENSVKLSVTDAGPGIEQSKIPHLFDRYYRADSRGTQFSGLGLGLYICAEIIKKHDGKIGVESTLGTGSSFWFTLPSQDFYSEAV